MWIFQGQQVKNACLTREEVIPWRCELMYSQEQRCMLHITIVGEELWCIFERARCVGGGRWADEKRRPHWKCAESVMKRRGLGTCGTCAVKIEGNVAPAEWTAQERLRLNCASTFSITHEPRRACLHLHFPQSRLNEREDMFWIVWAIMCLCANETQFAFGFKSYIAYGSQSLSVQDEHRFLCFISSSIYRNGLVKTFTHRVIPVCICLVNQTVQFLVSSSFFGNRLQNNLVLILSR